MSQDVRGEVLELNLRAMRELVGKPQVEVVESGVSWLAVMSVMASGRLPALRPEWR